jgi:hypothetical protein
MAVNFDFQSSAIIQRTRLVLTPSSPPLTTSRPPRRRSWIVGFGLAALLIIATVVPGSPLHFSVLFRPVPKDNGRDVRELVGALGHQDPVVRREAAAGLGRLNVAATESLPRLAHLLRNDPDPNVRSTAADSIRKMAPASAAFVAELAGALYDEDPLVRMNAALALLALKEKAHSAVPNLIAAVGDDDNDTNLDFFTMTVRQAVVRALGAAAAGTDAAVPALSAVLDGPASSLTKAAAAWGLGMAGPHARATAPVVRALLRDPDPDVRYEAEEALARMGEAKTGPIRSSEFDNLELPEDERKRIWEIEHGVNVINKYGFEPLASALAAGNSVRLARFFAPRFSGSEPADPIRAQLTGFANVERIQGSGRPPEPLTATQFVARLAALRQVFGAAPQVKLVAATLNPKEPADPAGLWQGQAQLRMHGESTAGAPAEVTAVIGFELPLPTEDVLGADGWLHAAHIRQVAVARAPAYLFAECAKARGLDPGALHDNWTAEEIVPSSGGVYVADFDRDGYLDLLVTDINRTALYRGGPGGKFTDVTDLAGLPRGGSWYQKAAWVDIDGDGWDDLILHLRIYRNEGGKRFTDFTEHVTPRMPTNRSSIVVGDYDRDGKLDLYITRTGPPGNLSWLQGHSDDAKGNRLYRNLGDWKFEDVTKKSGTRGGHRSTFTAAWLDANDDGWPDLHVPNEFGDGVLYINNRDGTFKPQALADRPADFGTMGLAVGDVDNDGKIDIYCANMYSKAGTRVIGNMKPDTYPPHIMNKMRRFVAGSQLHLNAGDGKFVQVGAEKQLASVGWAYAPALADLDGDGFLDVVAMAGYISRDRAKPDG